MSSLTSAGTVARKRAGLVATLLTCAAGVKLRMKKEHYLYIAISIISILLSGLGLKSSMAMVALGAVLIGSAAMSTNIKNKDYGDLIIPSTTGMNRSITGKNLLLAKLGVILLVSPLIAMALGVLLEPV